MDEKFIKRGYYFPEKLLDEWGKFHAPSKKDYSPSAAGAFLIWMALDSSLRAEARQKALLPDLKKAIKQIQKALVDNITNAEIQKFLASLSPKQRQQILADAKKSTEKSSRTK